MDQIFESIGVCKDAQSIIEDYKNSFELFDKVQLVNAELKEFYKFIGTQELDNYDTLSYEYNKNGNRIIYFNSEPVINNLDDSNALVVYKIENYDSKELYEYKYKEEEEDNEEDYRIYDLTGFHILYLEEEHERYTSFRFIEGENGIDYLRE